MLFLRVIIAITITAAIYLIIQKVKHDLTQDTSGLPNVTEYERGYTYGYERGVERGSRECRDKSKDLPM